MGYTKEGHITKFWPDDTDTTMYIEDNKIINILDIVAKAKEKWGEDMDLSSLTISVEHIHTDCLYYDGYDSSDWTDFIVLEY